MINLYHYQDCKKIKILADDDKEYIGYVGDITDVEDQSSDYSPAEDSISLKVDGKWIEFFQSEIKRIEVLDV